MMQIHIKGSIFFKVVAGLGGTTSFFAYVLPNTLLVNKFKDVTQLYKTAIPVPISSKTKDVITEVMNDMNMNEEQQYKVVPYTSCCFDIFHAGMLSLGNKGVIGLPKSFSYSSEFDFSTSGIKLNGEEIDWSANEGINLKKSLILSNNAQKFIIAQKLYYINSLQPLIKGCFASGLILTSAITSFKLAKKLQLHGKPLFNFTFYGIVSLFTFALWSIGHDSITCFYEKKSDNYVSHLGKNYIEGGIEFYEKILKRNIALRNLMGKEGESEYTAFGNVKVLFRTKNIPITVRRDDMKMKAG